MGPMGWAIIAECGPGTGPRGCLARKSIGTKPQLAPPTKRLAHDPFALKLGAHNGTERARIEPDSISIVAMPPLVQPRKLNLAATTESRNIG